MEPLNIIVLCGGLSTERNISFLTGSRVCAALRSRGHRAVLTDLYLGFEELGGEQYKKAVKCGKLDTDVLFSDLPPIPSFSFDGQAPDLEAVRRSRKWKNPSIFGNHVLEACRDADIVFVAVCLIKLLPAMALPLWILVWIGVIALIKVINVISGLAIRKQFISLHTAANKLTGALLFALPLTIGYIPLSCTGLP